jgi:hypothetical protein
LVRGLVTGLVRGLVTGLVLVLEDGMGFFGKGGAHVGSPDTSLGEGLLPESMSTISCS